MSPNNRTRFAIITGGSHRLGAVLSETVAKLGYSLVLHYNSSELEAKNLAKELRNIGVSVYLIKSDLSTINGIRRLWDYFDELNGNLSVFINSASIMSQKKFGLISPEDFDELIALNLKAPFLCSQEASKRMIEGGQIINISDIASVLNWTKYPLYSMSRSALDAMTRILAKDLAPKIRVNGIAPGLILPPIDQDRAEWERLIEKVPLKRSGFTEEISLAIRYLIENEYVTGQTIVIDGGKSIA